MSTLEELIKVQEAHEADLLAKPGVHGVGIGYKSIGGQVTDQIAIVILVDRKLSPENLRAEDIVPPSVGGVPTDVIEQARFEPATQVMLASEIDNRVQRPLIGGCAISADPPPVTPPPGQFVAGTLGGFASNIPDSPVLQFEVGISCNHVLGPLAQGPKRTNVLQPAGGPKVSELTMSVNDPQMGVDAAGFTGLVAGVSYSRNVLDLGAITGSHYVDLSDVGKNVYKSGINSRTTTGGLRFINLTVQVDVHGTLVWFEHQLGIIGAFADFGDSGSFVLLPDPTGPNLFYVIGLLMSKSVGDGPTNGVANNIRNVETALGIQFPAPPTS